MLSYEGISALQPRALTGLAIKKTQGKFFGSELLPERPHPEWSGYYKKYGSIAFGQQAPEVAEGGPVEMLNTGYTESSFTMKEYRTGFELTERALAYLMKKDSKVHKSAGRAILNDEMEVAVDRIRLRQEKRILDEIVANASAGNQVSVGNLWSDTTNGTPVTDIRSAIVNIRNNEHIEADTLIITANNEKNILLSDEVSEWFKYTTGSKVAQSAGMSRAMPAGICGLDVFVVDAVTMSGIEAAGTESNILGDTYAIVMKRGKYAGGVYVAANINSNSWFEGNTRTTRVDVQKIFVPVIYRDKAIAILRTVA